MKTPAYTAKFKKDYKTAIKRSYDINKLINVMDDLLNDRPLPPIRHDHALKGSYQDSRECHIESDWLLIYKPNRLEILFERTGTHADLFE